MIQNLFIIFKIAKESFKILLCCTLIITLSPLSFSAAYAEKKIRPSKKKTSTVYLVANKDEIKGTSNLDVSPDMNSQTDSNVMKLSNASSENSYQNVASSDGQPSQFMKPQNINELRNDLVLVEQNPDNWIYQDQGERTSFARETIIRAKQLLSQGYPRDDKSTQEEVDFIIETSIRGQLYEASPAPKSNDESLFYDFKYCQNNNNLFAFFVEDPTADTAQRIVLCQKFFDNALKQSSPEQQKEFATKMYLALILHDSGMSNERVVELLFTQR